MRTKDLINLIDETLVDIWTTDISRDYNSEWLLQEDPLKCALYFHLRNRLGKVFEENGIRIYTEYMGKPFRDAHKKPDMIIAKINTEMDYDYLGETVEEILAVIEIKLKNGFAGSNTIYNDYEKLKCYACELGVSAKLYMATIWEYEDDPTTWERKNAAWAKGRLTELNASYVRGSDHEMRFYVCPHK